jgi:hypothetical protein
MNVGSLHRPSIPREDAMRRSRTRIDANHKWPPIQPQSGSENCRGQLPWMHSTVKNGVKIASLTCNALLVSLFTPEVTVELK